MVIPVGMSIWFTLNNWSGKIKAMKLVACMQDAALSTLGDINTNSPPSYEDLH